MLRNGYEWLEVDHDLRTFLSMCPEAVAGKYLAITAVDSGTFTPSEADLAKGWKTLGRIAYSPLLRSTEDLPKDCCCRDCAGFDEWYVFEAPRKPGSLCQDNIFTTDIAPGNVFAFINYFFRPSEPKMREMQAITDLFWKQIEWMKPESYIADGADCLIFASRNKALFTSVRTTLEMNPAD